MTVTFVPPQHRTAWLEIDLDAMRHNIGVIRTVVGSAAVAPVVKADAYGHGVERVGPALAPAADALCVATLDEAIALRSRVEGRILLLYPVPAAAASAAVVANVELAVMSAADLQAIRDAVHDAARPDAAPVRVHVGVETGMGRGGLLPEAVAEVVAAAVADPHVELAGLWSHLHSPEDPPSSDAQILRFEVAVAALREAGLPIPPRHIAASGGIFTHDEPSLDLVRPGIAVYGVLDSDLPIAPDAVEAASRLRPAMSLKARAVAFSDVPAGGTVGYGGTWRADRPSRIAVLPVGYGDGYLRGSQPGAVALARGRRVPLVGRVSMDAVTVDVTDLPGLDYAEEFVLLGRQGSASVTAGELARRRNTIAWEALASMAQRVGRVYYPKAGTAQSE
ncbi:MAG: alanine racemase [Planctomycetota bacterium]|nr:MAG: alanine racemase [Planctomycetota bacterium]